MVDHRMNVSITNNAQFPLAEIALDASESVRIQTGSMIYHTPNVVLNAKVNAESQSIFGMAIQAVGRSMASGEGVFITEATAQSNNGRLALAPNVPGQIVALELGEKQYRLNDGAFSGYGWICLLYFGEAVGRSSSLWWPRGLLCDEYPRSGDTLGKFLWLDSKGRAA